MCWGLPAEMRQCRLSYKALPVCGWWGESTPGLCISISVNHRGYTGTLTPCLRQVLLASHPQGQLQAELWSWKYLLPAACLLPFRDPVASVFCPCLSSLQLSSKCNRIKLGSYVLAAPCRTCSSPEKIHYQSKQRISPFWRSLLKSQQASHQLSSEGGSASKGGQCFLLRSRLWLRGNSSIYWGKSHFVLKKNTRY